ncbi:Co2+/Mg2+ efflux protein ApaG [Chitinophagales bacterium]|nr:Co2+/Mg2+ efflux protein ApaG [Chitinophagales bacterium]
MTRYSSITKGVKVSACAQFEPFHSKPEQGEYIFSYEITIENNSSSTLQLMSRYWFIFDADGTSREIQGDGVVGRQPILEPGSTHKYRSACNLNSPFGYMHGTYTMIRRSDESQFEVDIPEFMLEFPDALN